MTVGKAKDSTSSKAPEPQTSRARKPWKKKTPVDILLDQVDKLRQEIVKDEEALTKKKEQLQKFEEARKLFESK